MQPIFHTLLISLNFEMLKGTRLPPKSFSLEHIDLEIGNEFEFDTFASSQYGGKIVP